MCWYGTIYQCDTLVLSAGTAAKVFRFEQLSGNSVFARITLLDSLWTHRSMPCATSDLAEEQQISQ